MLEVSTLPCPRHFLPSVVALLTVLTLTLHLEQLFYQDTSSPCSDSEILLWASYPSGSSP